MKPRCFQGLSEKYLQTVWGVGVPLDRPFYEANIWWWKTILNGEMIGTGDAESGMSRAELESYKETIFRYEFMARISGEYAHGKPWAWLEFDTKFGCVTESGDIDRGVFDYRDFVAQTHRVLDGSPPANGWSGHLGFWFRLDAPKSRILAELEKMVDREREKRGVQPKLQGRPKDHTPWHILETMDETVNKVCRNSAFDNDRTGAIPRLVESMLGYLPRYESCF